MMRWNRRMLSDMSGGWIEANTVVGDWLIEPCGEGYAAWWSPIWRGDDVLVGRYKTERGAKRGCRCYARRIAAEFARVGAEE